MQSDLFCSLSVSRKKNRRCYWAQYFKTIPKTYCSFQLNLPIWTLSNYLHHLELQWNLKSHFILVTPLLMFIFFPNYFSPCNCFISSAMIKNNQIIVRSFDTNWRRLLNSTAAVLDVRGRSLREEEEEDVSTGSAQCPCTTVPVLQPHWLLQGSWGSTSATFHTSPTTLYMFLMENERTSGIVLPPVMCGCVQHRASGNTEGAWNRFRGHLLSVRVQKL